MPHDTVWADVAAIREKTPLVLNITNDVVTNTTANAPPGPGGLPGHDPRARGRPRPGRPGLGPWS